MSEPIKIDGWTCSIPPSGRIRALTFDDGTHKVACTLSGQGLLYSSATDSLIAVPREAVAWLLAEQPTDSGDYESAMVRSLEAERLKVNLLNRSVSELARVALEAAAMLAETNHGGLTHERSESMKRALVAAGVEIPAQCSECPEHANMRKAAP